MPLKQRKEKVMLFAKALNIAGVPVWFDEWEIQAGESIPDNIEQGLLNSYAVLLFLSSGSLESPWVKHELNITLMRKLKNKDIKLIPVKLEECSTPDIINYIKWISLIEQESYESGFHLLLNSLFSKEEIKRIANNIPNALKELNRISNKAIPSAGERYIECPQCGGPSLNLYSEKKDSPDGFDFIRGIQCLQCGSMFEAFPAPQCPECHKPMLWRSQGMSEGAYGSYEDDFAFECSNCGFTKW